MMDRSRYIQLALVTAVLGTAAVLVFAPDNYLPMLARSFMLQGAFVFFLLALLAGWKRYWSLSTSGVGACSMMLFSVGSPPIASRVEAGSVDLRVAHMNVWQMNTDHEAVVRKALATGADMISVQEVDHEWARALVARLSDTFPYSIVEARTNCYGIALFSKRPFSEARTHEIHGSPFIEVVVDVKGQPVRVLSVHATSPISTGHFQRRNAQLAAVADRIASSELPTMLIGDLNTVHWDDAYRSFCVRSGVRPVNDTSVRTWPSVGPFALIPLDHAMLSSGLGCTSLNTFDVPGSDHRGLLAEIHLVHAH